MVFKTLKLAALTKGRYADRRQEELRIAQCHVSSQRTSLNLSFLLCQMGIIILFTTQIGCDDKMQ